jgi:ferritin-like metal-binding protein YciE
VRTGNSIDQQTFSLDFQAMMEAIMQDLEKLLIGELQDIYDAENQLVATLPKMAEKASSPALKNAFNHHLEQTRQHVRRVEQAFNTLGQKPKKKTCKGMKGLIDEGEHVAAAFEKNTALDAALIGAAQKVEHYEITSYGTLCSWADELGAGELKTLLKQNLAEEKEADVKLTELAAQAANPRAATGDTHKRGPVAASIAKKMG